MQLLYSPTSPFVRKVLVVAHELGLIERIEKVPTEANPVNRNRDILRLNALAQVPTLILDDGRALADSRVICEYLDDLAGGRIFPSGSARWTALIQQSLGDGLLDAALLARYERNARPAELQWSVWLEGQVDKIRTALAAISQHCEGLGDRVDIGSITLACALSYLDLRFADLEWRSGFPGAASWYAAFSERPSMRATQLG